MAENYARYGLPELWRMVADEDPEAGFAHVNALNRLRTALEQQRANLRAQRDRLEEAWPPERSDAAAAFVARINGMIEAMTYTVSAAGRICVGVDEVFAAVREARRQLEQLVVDSQRAPGQGLQAGNARIPQLDERARDVMIAADAQVAEAAPMIRAVIPVYPRIRDAEDGTEVTSGANPSGASASAARRRAAADGRGSRTQLLPAPVFDPPPSSAGGGDDGPVLASGPTGHWSAPGADGPAVYPAGGPAAGRLVPFPTGADTVVPRIVGPGGVIGAPRSSAPIGGGQPMTVPVAGGAGARSAVTSTTRQPAVAGASGGAGLREPRPVNGTTEGYRDRSFEEYVDRRRGRRRSDPDELWPVAEGVPPVLEATMERPHDPGPGVIGIDR